ncbi:MAG: endonuclease VII [Acidobacteria bacterium]|nr:endonuclease VII [Acidobacteriota bacterium]|tara:strand:- start:30476 stop:30985 length:510 start_codon:yes stop_codon:yes gene_type:complete
MKQLITKEVLKQKEDFYALQGGECAICQRPLGEDFSKIHLDHDHELHGDNAGKCRGALCTFCNRLEGDIKKKFIHSGLESRGVEQLDWLRSLISYLETDLSKRNIHPNHVNDYSKWVCKQNKDDILKEFEKIGYKPDPKLTIKQLSKLFKKEFRKYQKQTYTDYYEVNQ